MAEIEIPSPLRSDTGGAATVNVEATNLLAALRELDHRFDGLGRRLRTGRSVVVDGVLHPTVGPVPLEPDSHVSFVASVAGG